MDSAKKQPFQDGDTNTAELLINSTYSCDLSNAGLLPRMGGVAAYIDNRVRKKKDNQGSKLSLPTGVHHGTNI